MSQFFDLNHYRDGGSGVGWYTVPLLSQQSRWRITRGIDAGGAWPRPTKIECTINNDSLRYDPDNPSSIYYGLIGRNTPTRARVNGTTRAMAEASLWLPDKTVEHVSGANKGLAWVTFTAEGVLRRLGKWEDPLRSPMYRTISGRATSIGHWPIEDGRGSDRLANSHPAGRVGAARGVDLGDDDTPAGSASSAAIKDGSRMAGVFKSASTTAGWQVCWSFRASALPPSATYVEMFRFTAANGYRYVFSCNNISFWMHVEDSDGVAITDPNFTFGTGASPTSWMTMRLAVQQVGGNVSYNWAWYMQDMNVFFFVANTFPGTISRLSSWEQLGNATTAGWLFTQIFGVTGLTDDLMSYNSRLVFNGYRGERALTRFYRILAELGIPRYGVGAESDSTPMGPQRPDTLLSLLREIMITEDGIIYDERFDATGLTMWTRRALCSQAPVATFTWPAQVAPPFRKEVGDTFTWNRVTVKNVPGGGEVTVTQDTGRMSTQPPPAGVGEVKTSVEVNVAQASTQLQDRATWELAKGTLLRAAYSTVTIDLLANPSLEATVNSINLGDRIDVAGYEPETIKLLVVGIVDEGDAVERTVTFATVPYEPYDVGIFDDASFRWDSKTSVLSGAQTSSSTAWTVTCSDPNDVWSTNPASYPLDWMVAGERVRVNTPPSAPGAAPTYAQTVTVARAVNGVSKAQLDQARVELADPKRWHY